MPAMPCRLEALVAGAITEAEASQLLRVVIAQLPLPVASVSKMDPGPRPSAVLTRRPSWQGPVAQSLCRASGLPALLDVCGRSMR